MSSKIKPPSNQTDQFVADTRKDRQQQEKTYRERALKLFPWICGRCGREFSGKKLCELTVHHKDSNHDNNPPDGSNWELLCVYCHDNEHERNKVADAYSGDSQDNGPGEKSSTFRPFADLEKLLKGKKE